MALTGKRPPLISSIQDLTIIEAFDPGAAEAKYVTFYFLTPEDDFYFSQLFKPKKEISLAKFNATLEYVPDKDIYPEQRTDILLTTAPDGLDDGGAFIKRPCLIAYESLKGTDFIPKEVLAETLIMERLSRSPHPNIIRYLGCCVRGLAHNDINPHSIMIRRDGTPVLIDFGSCRPVGGRLQSLGSPGWYEEVIFTSQTKHDEFSLKELAQWLEKPE